MSVSTVLMKGDTLIFNAKILQIPVGTRATITDFDNSGVWIKLPSGRSVHIPSVYLQNP